MLLAASVGCTNPQTIAPTPTDTSPGSDNPALSSPPHNSLELEADDTPTEPDDTASNATTNLGQQLPITAKTTLGGKEIFLEVAATPAQQALGLMYRDALPDDRGMVFPMNPPRPVRFWMMNVPVALDMVFVYQGQIQYIAAEVPPCIADPCPTYGPDNQLIDHVIELRAGRAAELGLQVGDAVEILPID
ncbi:hypothetical protein GFS31_19590 [Leptolyngbya sp. BL0902]|nr:hypothetical protein GFS31_19590 [Leptolyngbya sp. BL0902]